MSKSVVIDMTGGGDAVGSGPGTGPGAGLGAGPPALVSDDTDDKLNEITGDLMLIKSMVSETLSKLKSFDKAYHKEKKKRTETKSSKMPLGFSKPTAISDDLCVFMNVNKGTKVARIDVTRYINKYIVENKLQNVGDRTIINPDERLKSLFTIYNTEPGFILKYFNMQKHLKHHFLK